MRTFRRSEPKCGKLLTLKPTSLFDDISIKKKCVQNVKEILGFYKEWKEIINKLLAKSKKQLICSYYPKAISAENVKEQMGEMTCLSL